MKRFGPEGKYVVYEAKFNPCRICNERQSILLPFCIKDGKEFVYPVCVECRDKIPFEVIPVKATMGEGAYYCPQKSPILTRYGKKLTIINKVRNDGMDSLSCDEKEFLSKSGVDFIIMKDGNNVYLR